MNYTETLLYKNITTTINDYLEQNLIRLIRAAPNVRKSDIEGKVADVLNSTSFDYWISSNLTEPQQIAERARLTKEFFDGAHRYLYDSVREIFSSFQIENASTVTVAPASIPQSSASYPAPSMAGHKEGMMTRASAIPTIAPAAPKHQSTDAKPSGEAKHSTDWLDKCVTD